MWEFLLQKKGDKSWLPLESPTVEILAGEYRIASRSEFSNQNVSTICRYQPSLPQIPARTQELQQTVNQEGLLLVIPFTQFTEGNWRIECGISQGFRAVLDLVVPSNSVNEDELEFDTNWLDSLTDNFEIESDAPPVITPLALSIETNHFLLDQETTVLLTGNSPAAGQLQVVIKHPHPHNPGYLFDREFVLAQPGPFKLPITLPETSDSLVLLGEVRWQNTIVSTLTFTFPGSRIVTPKPKMKLDLPLPKKKIQPMPPPNDLATNGKVSVIDTASNIDDEDLFGNLDDIFAPIDLIVPPPPPPQPINVSPAKEEFSPPPIPQIELVCPQLEAGTPILLRATIPDRVGNWAIKLWIKDCQTRRIVDGPRWLLDWETVKGIKQTESYICFPFGCLTATIEAITVELTTTDQSRKFYLECPIVPLKMTRSI